MSDPKVIESEVVDGFPNCSTIFIKDRDTGILIDPGLSKYYVGEENGVIARLDRNGIEPKDIDIILLTHLHGDHFSGCIDLMEKCGMDKFEIFTNVHEMDNTVYYSTPFVPVSQMIRITQDQYTTIFTETMSVFRMGRREKSQVPVKVIFDFIRVPELLDKLEKILNVEDRSYEKIKGRKEEMVDKAKDALKHGVSGVMRVLEDEGYPKFYLRYIASYYITYFLYRRFQDKWDNFVEKTDFIGDGLPYLEEGKMLSRLKNLSETFRIYFTPGHAVGHMSYLYKDHFLAGDLFANGKREDIKIKIDDFKEKLVSIPAGYEGLAGVLQMSERDAIKSIQKLKKDLKDENNPLGKVNYIVPGHGAKYVLKR